MSPFEDLKQVSKDSLKNQDVFKELNLEEKEKIENDVREIMGVENDEAPVILDLESVRVLNPGKFEIDIVNLLNKNRPMIYKLGEGKYIIDIESSLRDNKRRDRGDGKESSGNSFLDFKEVDDKDEFGEIELNVDVEEGKKVVIGEKGEVRVGEDTDEEVEGDGSKGFDSNKKDSDVEYLDLTDESNKKDEKELE